MMIELKFTGTPQEVQSEIFDFANTLASGRHLQNLAAKAAQAQDVQVDVEEVIAASNAAEKPKAADKPKVKKAKAEEPVKEEQLDIEEVIATAPNVEKVEDTQTVPSTIDELRALAMTAMEKIGNNSAKAILNKYSPKLADIPKDKIAACARDFYKAMEAA